MKNFSVYRSSERRTTAYHWGTISETFYGSQDGKYLGVHDLVQFDRCIFPAGKSISPMKLHRNMELIDIVISGTAGYFDGNGMNTTIPENTMTVVSAGKGLFRSEFNGSDSEVLDKIQIGILPRTLNTGPIQTKALFDLRKNKNTFIALISPINDISTLSVRQRAAVLMGEFDAREQFMYDVSGGNTALFLSVVRGVVTVGDQKLYSNDGIAVMTPQQIAVTFAEESVLLLLEVEIPKEENQ